jgi:hypothetical protein
MNNLDFPNCGYVYLINTEELSNIYKIGFTKKDPNIRLKQLQTGNPNKLNLFYSFKVKDESIEHKLHNIFKNKKINNEWFCLTHIDIYDILNEEFQLLDLGNDYFEYTTDITSEIS